MSLPTMHECGQSCNIEPRANLYERAACSSPLVPLASPCRGWTTCGEYITTLVFAMSKATFDA